MNPLHTPEELQYFTNLGHWFEGAILGVIAIIYLFQLLGYIKSKKAQYIIPILVFVGGLFLSPYLFLHHGLDKVGLVWDFIMNDPAQLQHFIMGNLLLIAGLIEILITAKVLRSKLWQLVLPLSLAIIGFLFLIHPQHGMGAEFIRSTRIHHYLGWLIIGGSVFHGIGLQDTKYRKLSYVWVLTLLICASLLFVYREPGGSHPDTPTPNQKNMDMQKGHH